MPKPRMSVQLIQPVLEFHLDLSEGWIFQFDNFLEIFVFASRFHQFCKDVCEVDRLAELLFKLFKLLSVEHMAEQLFLVLGVERVRPTATVGNHLAILDGWERVFVAVELVVHAIIEIIALVSFHDDGEVVAIPVVATLDQPQQQFI